MNWTKFQLCPFLQKHRAYRSKLSILFFLLISNFREGALSSHLFGGGIPHLPYFVLSLFYVQLMCTFMNRQVTY